jgi:hypothetical protein
MQNKLADSLTFSVTLHCKGEKCVADHGAKQQHQSIRFQLAEIPRHMTLDQFLEYRLLEELGWTWQGESGELWCPSCSIIWRECMYCKGSFDRATMIISNIARLVMSTDPEAGTQYVCRDCKKDRGIFSQY